MTKIRRWLDERRRVVWTEPKLPPYVKINPDAADPDPDMGLQPGELSMGMVAHDFLLADDDVGEDGAASHTLQRVDRRGRGGAYGQAPAVAPVLLVPASAH